MGEMGGIAFIILFVIVGIIIIYRLGKAFFRLIGISAKEQDPRQMDINQKAQPKENEQWHAVGESAQEAKKKGGLLGCLIIIGIIIIVVLMLLDNIR